MQKAVSSGYFQRAVCMLKSRQYSEPATTAECVPKQGSPFAALRRLSGSHRLQYGWNRGAMLHPSFGMELFVFYENFSDSIYGKSSKENFLLTFCQPSP